jgi:hypothetical protein
MSNHVIGERRAAGGRAGGRGKGVRIRGSNVGIELPPPYDREESRNPAANRAISPLVGDAGVSIEAVL